MTTPIENILPYGVSMVPTVGSPHCTAVTSHPKADGRFLILDSGPTLATFTWDGAEVCELWLSRGSKIIKLGDIPAKSGGGIRPAKSVRFGALDGDRLYIYLRPFHVETTIPPTATIEVIPTYSG